MKHKQNTLFWGLGLSDIENLKIKAATTNTTLKNFPAHELPKDEDMGGDAPFIIWIPYRQWLRLSADYRAALLEWEPAQKVLLLDGEEDIDTEELLDLGFLTVLKRPITEAKVRDTVARAEEVHSLYADIMRMTQEIALEREILSRKTDYLLFLNNFMARVSESLNPATILATARRDLCELFPVSAAQAIFWQQTGENYHEAEVFMAFHDDSSAQEEWLELLLESAKKISGHEISSYQMTYVMEADVADPEADLSPSPGKVILMPLRAGGKDYGCLALLTHEPVRLTKQERDVLHSAVSNLGLALKNALLYREVKLRADHDGLTRIFNRRYFDERLIEEMSRAQRYGQDISLMMFDLDHFKHVNDTYGHQAGDLVLKEMGALLQETLRSTDFAARYGGEEFAVILPHTGEANAWQLAERLRRKVERLQFTSEGTMFKVTTSIGVASFTPGSFSRNTDLLKQADKALYQAKASGRNMVCTFSNCDEYGLQEEAQ